LPNFPVRNLGGTGIITDIPPYDLPPNALSAGVNIRFENGKITRGPVYRELLDLPSDFSPEYVFAIPPVTEGQDAIITVGSLGQKIYSYTGGTTTIDVTPDEPHIVNTEYPWSHTFLGSVAYLNQKDGVPLMRRQSDLKFVPLTAWPENYRCASLRSYKDFLIAMGVAQVGNEYPTMVKWSDFATFGSPPSSWAIDDTTNSAGENIVNEMRSPIIDGLTLRDNFIIYCQSEVWVMSYVAGNFMFSFRRLFDRAGIINQNCVVQVDGLHYVFDRNDIYVNDGTTKRSICEGMVRDFIFSGGIAQDKRHLCFATHDPRLSEIYFAYPSNDALTGFSGPTTGCNRIAAFNYRDGSWSFYDAPNVVGSAASVIPSGISYEDMAAVGYPDANDPYRAQSLDKETHTVFASAKDTSQDITKSRLLGLDLLSEPRLPGKQLCTEAIMPCLAERVGVDLDEDGRPISSYKVVHTLYPQLSLTDAEDTIEFQFGATDSIGSEPVWTDGLVYDPAVTIKVDTGRVAGRYLSWRLNYDGPGDFSYSGFDAKIVARGRRG
jgi:hypothetical protein